jgi:hypothetical protein
MESYCPTDGGAVAGQVKDKRLSEGGTQTLVKDKFTILLITVKGVEALLTWT